MGRIYRLEGRVTKLKEATDCGGTSPFTQNLESIIIFDLFHLKGSRLFFYYKVWRWDHGILFLNKIHLLSL